MAKPVLVLLVDANERHAGQFAQSLELLRLRNPLRRVSNVDEAIQYLSGKSSFQDRDQHPFPVVLFAGIRLPETPRLLAWMEAHPLEKPAGIVALTSSHDMRPVIQAFHLGVHAFLQEPLKLEDLRMAFSAIPRTTLETDHQGGFWIEEYSAR